MKLVKLIEPIFTIERHLFKINRKKKIKKKDIIKKLKKNLVIFSISNGNKY
jgi:hypothetical protein